MKDIIVAFFAVLLAVGLFVGLVAAGPLAWNAIVLEPAKNESVQKQVEGLITAYCTSPRPADQAAARAQLQQLLAGESERVSRTPARLQVRAQMVIANNGEVCQ